MLKNLLGVKTDLPRKEYTFDHIEILHQHISFGLRAEISYRVSNPQLNGSFESG